MMGPSGSGKSTMVNLIGCLDRPTTGEIWLDGQNVASLSPSDLNHVRAETIGFVFQQFHMIPYLTAVENVMLAQYFHSMTDEKEALEALERVGLRDRAGHLPSQLSGGEQQRVCIARALINDPKIILADEPTGNLDAVNEEIVLRLLRELHQQGRTIVMVTHDPVVARLADRRIELHHGKIAAQEVFAMADEEQFDEVLEELYALEEHNQIAEIARMEVHGALPVSIAVEKMEAMGLVATHPHPPQPHDHKPFVNPCHDALKPSGVSTGEGSLIVELTTRGRQRAADIIRRHRLAERLFTDSLAMDSETEIEQQACKFEHILSAEATDKICAFLGHPRTLSPRLPNSPRPMLRKAARCTADIGGIVTAVRPSVAECEVSARNITGLFAPSLLNFTDSPCKFPYNERTALGEPINPDSGENTMKKLRIALLMLALFVPAALLAQAGGQGDPGAGPMGAAPHMPSVDDQLDQLSTRLNLTDAQKPQVRAILQDQHDQMVKAMDNSSGERQDPRAKMRQVHQASATKIRALLTDEQKVAFDKMQEEHRNHMKHGNDQGAPPPDHP